MTTAWVRIDPGLYYNGNYRIFHEPLAPWSKRWFAEGVGRNDFAEAFPTLCGAKRACDKNANTLHGTKP